MRMEIIVAGGGICGLAAGLMLAREGHRVTVLEGDPAPVPDSVEDAWEGWSRSGVAQFNQAHILVARGRHVLDAELPDVRDAFVAAGAVRLDPLDRLPPSVADREPRPEDDRLATVTARRPTLEQVVARAAEAEAGMDVRRGVAVAGLTTRMLGGTPNVVGVRTDSGETLTGDLVVDAMGRRSPLPAWLRDAGAKPGLEEAEDSGFIYYTRFFRASNGGEPPRPRTGLLTPLGSFSILTLPADHGTWSVTVYTASGDQPLKVLRHEHRWTSLVRACPLHAHWLDGEPITGILPMGGVIDRIRRLVDGDGRPVVTGVATLADAWACTNPSLGRGIALGLLHAALLRAVVRAYGDDPEAFARAWDEATERELTPWYRATVAADRARLAEIEALRTGCEPPAPGDIAARVRAALPTAMSHDADVFRAGLEILGCLTLPNEVFARPGLAERVLEIARDHEASPPPGPTREGLLRLLG